MVGSETVIIALGGNALQDPGRQDSYEQQQATVERTAELLAPYITGDDAVVLTHGNGPQIGSILRQNLEAAEVTPPMPLFANGAQTQGLIGYMIQSALLSTPSVQAAGMDVVPVVTPVRVDQDDPAFENPTKPIGPYLGAAEAERLEREQGWVFREFPGDGYRQVVPSPEPRAVFNVDIVESLIEAGAVPIVAGGGGVPVVDTEAGGITGTNAVIDKDLTGSLLGQQLNADVFVILTNVAQVALNYGEPDQVDLEELTVSEAREYMEAGHFARGSMYEKVEAACRFVEGDGSRRAVITALDNVGAALDGEAGTEIRATDSE